MGQKIGRISLLLIVLAGLLCVRGTESRSVTGSTLVAAAVAAEAREDQVAGKSAIDAAADADSRESSPGIIEKEAEVSQRVLTALSKIKKGGGDRSRSLSHSREVVQVAPGRNEVITVAGDHLNRIVTPFENPRVNTVSKAKVKTEENNSAIYVSLGKDDGEAALFITEEGEQEPCISLTLVPKEVPPREVRLKLAGNFPVSVGAGALSVGAGGSSKAAKWEKGQAYVEAVEQVLLRTARGEVPPGYNLRDYFNYDPRVSCSLPVAIEPRQVLEGHNFLVVIARMTNRSSSPLVVNEEACYRPGVRAVSVWPRVRVAPKQTSELYVVFQRATVRPPRLRPSVLNLLPEEVPR